MLFEKTALPGVVIITLQPIHDDRGFFARSFCKNKLESAGLQNDFVQSNISYNHKKGTLRGLHYQTSPHEEIKIVSCRRGAIYDVVVDIRENSPTYHQWIGIELSADNYRSLYIPKGFAHGFITLCDDVELHYLMNNYYHPEAAAGIHWNDPSLAIAWPNKPIIISDKDKNLPRLTP